MINEIQIPFKFTPRSYQLDLLRAMDSGYKRAIAVYHRRAGKDKTLFNLMIKKAIERVGVYFYFLPEFAQGRRVIWDGIDGSGMPFRDHIPKPLIEKANSTDMKIRLINGSIIQIIGTDKFDKVRGANPVGCVFSEQAFQNPNAWDIVRPILAENGGWAVFNSTPNGKNHFHKLYQMALNNPSWFTQNVNVEQSLDSEGNRYVSADVIEEERLSGMSEEMIQQEFYNSFTSNSEGFYYLSQMDDAEKSGRIGNVPYDPTIPVDTWWDIGVGDSTAIWFTQLVKKEIHVIDFYQYSSVGVEHYAKYLQGLPYVYGTHHFPHDMINTEFGSGRTRMEVAEELFRASAKIDRIQKVGLEDGINAARMIIPRCWFDEKRCHKGIDALFNYHRQWDDKFKEYKNKPVHDWCLAPDTLIRTTNGWKAINNIVSGDYVFGYSEKEGRIIPSKVAWSGPTRQDAVVIEIGLSNGRSITCTPDHQFLLLDGGYREAQELLIDDALMPFYESLNRKYLKIDLLDGSFADEHRYVYSKTNKNIIPNGYHIDHLDGNRFNNNPSNLKLLSKEEHCSKTFKGIKNHQRKEVDKTPNERLLISKQEMWIKCRNCGKDYWGNYKTSYCSDECRKGSQKCYGGIGPKYDETPYMRVRYIRHIEEKINTYDISVPETNNFVAEGVVVHNSSHPADAFRYFAVGLTMPKVKSNRQEFLNRYKRLSARGWQVA